MEARNQGVCVAAVLGGLNGGSGIGKDEGLWEVVLGSPPGGLKEGEEFGLENRAGGMELKLFDDWRPFSVITDEGCTDRVVVELAPVRVNSGNGKGEGVKVFG